jgi:hypothetical protein
MSTMHQLVIRLTPYDDESITSIIQRHCDANAIQRTRDLLGLVSENSGATVETVQKVCESDSALRGLADLIGYPPELLLRKRLVVLEGASGPQVRQGHHEWPEQARIGKAQLLCLDCLADEPYAKDDWEFVQAPVCIKHRCQLIDACPHCGHLIRHIRATVLHCADCGRKLADGQALSPVSDYVVRAAELVLFPRTLGLGRRDSTSPIDVDELSKLLRLCLLPHPGEDSMYGIHEKLSALPIQRRVDALEVLGAAVDGRIIDSEVLWQGLIKRWCFAPALSHTEQIRLIRECCSQLQLPRDVAWLICYGDDAAPADAAETFDGAPPQLQSKDEIAAFLGVGLTMLKTLLTFVPISPQSGRDDGFDMDEVLEVQRFFQDCLSLDTVDALLGISGLGRELLDLKLLAGLSTRASEHIVHPSEVTRLFLAVQQRMEADSQQGLIRLGDAADAGEMQIRDIARVVAQVVGGSLRIGGWEAPFRLADVLVDEVRLHQIVKI